jgi:hypothetical protein
MYPSNGIPRASAVPISISVVRPQPAQDVGGCGRCPVGYDKHRFCFCSSSPFFFNPEKRFASALFLMNILQIASALLPLLQLCFLSLVPLFIFFRCFACSPRPAMMSFCIPSAHCNDVSDLSRDSTMNSFLLEGGCPTRRFAKLFKVHGCHCGCHSQLKATEIVTKDCTCTPYLFSCSHLDRLISCLQQQLTAPVSTSSLQCGNKLKGEAPASKHAARHTFLSFNCDCTVVAEFLDMGGILAASLPFSNRMMVGICPSHEARDICSQR